MGVGEYISRNLNQPAKSISNYDEKILVATLSNIQSDAKLLETEKTISAILLNNFFLDTIRDMKYTTKNQSNHATQSNQLKC